MYLVSDVVQRMLAVLDLSVFSRDGDVVNGSYRMRLTEISMYQMCSTDLSCSGTYYVTQLP